MILLIKIIMGIVGIFFILWLIAAIHTHFFVKGDI